MPTVEEITGAPLELAAGLHAGVETLSGRQEITFVKYLKLVLPLDGFVFYVKSDLLSHSALFNAMRFNSWPFAKPETIVVGAATKTVKGSIHYATDNRQEQEKNSTINYIVFTAENEVQDLNAVGSTVLYLGEFQGQRFAFSQRGKFYKQSGLWHYRGDAVYPVMETQIIDGLHQLDTRNLIVSNSLPIWLGLNAMMPVYPSYLADANIAPPFCAVHIEPGSTEGLAMAPLLDSKSNQYQLAKEPVRFTVWGLRNLEIMDYIRYLCDDSLMRPELWGLMNIPIPQDEKFLQKEMNVIAQKKTFTLEVNYLQSAVRNIARQLILSAFATYTPTDNPA